MKKILIVSTVSRQFYLFEQGNIEVLKSLGYEVHAAANFSDANERLDNLDIIRHHFDIERSPFTLKNIKAYRQLKKIMQSEKFDVVHCHSPMGGVLARLAAKSTKFSKVIYTAHGFHFYRGAPLINWLLYYPIEKYLSRYTDILITINQEDYMVAKKFIANRAIYIPGIGVDVKKISSFYSENIDEIRQEIDIPNNSFVVVSVGELNKNKNHEVIIKAIAKLKDPTIYYIICGQGDRLEHLKQLSHSLGIADKVKFLGYRNDVLRIYRIANLFAFPSYREGLSMSLMEAMASRLPIICSNIRGNKDLIENGIEGYLFHPKDIKGFSKTIEELKGNSDLCLKMSGSSFAKIDNFNKQIINNKMTLLYNSINED